MISFEKILTKFPEAQEAERGGGSCYTVKCWRWHSRTSGMLQMEIRADDGVFYCHNCHHAGSIYEEFPNHFDDTEKWSPWVNIHKGAISISPVVSRHNNRGSKTMWGDAFAPGETVPFRVLKSDHPAKIYLRDRGFDIDELDSFDPMNDIRALHYCTAGQFPICRGQGALSGRIIIPIYREEMAIIQDGSVALIPKLAGWQARKIEIVEEENDQIGLKKVWSHHGWQRFKKIDGLWDDRFVPKYYTCPEMKKSTLLGGSAHAKFCKDVAVVEGPLDHLKAGVHSVYTLGDSLSETQARMIKTIWDRVFIIRDPEVDTQSQRFRKMLLDLQPLEVHHLVLADGKDPGGTPRESIWQQVADHVGDPSIINLAKQR